jgi:eukaryotic-like serine/threonine-protein kinase
VLVRVAVTGGAAEGPVTLQVVDTWPAYEVVPAAAPDGPSLRAVPGRGETTVRMTLVATPGGWRIAGAERLA